MVKARRIRGGKRNWIRDVRRYLRKSRHNLTGLRRGSVLIDGPQWSDQIQIIRCALDEIDRRTKPYS